MKALAVEQEVAQLSRAVKSGNLSAGGSAPAMAMGTRKTGVAKFPANAKIIQATAPTDNVRLEQQLGQMQARRMALERYAMRPPSAGRLNATQEGRRDPRGGTACATGEAAHLLRFSLAQCLSHGGCRETAKARSEEERFCRELEAVQKAERLAGLNAAQVRDRRTHNTHCCRPGGEQG